jgi:hypothetical protein
MAKAIVGAALVLGAAAATIATWGAATPLLIAAIGTAASMGTTLLSSAIAQSLSDQRGMGITTRQAAGLRQVVYGTQRIGGTTCYMSTTGVNGGSGNFVYNFVIVLASHILDGLQAVYLDGRACYFSQDGNTANVGCGSIPTTATSAPPTATATVSGGAVISITATGGFGFNNVKPTRYRVRITGGGGSGAAAFATLEGGSFLSSAGQNLGDARTGTWTVTITEGGSGYTSAPDIDIQGLCTIGGAFAADQQDPSQPGFGLGFGIGPGGPHYNFAGLGFMDIRFGDQPPSDVMTSLQANDSNWPSDAHGQGLAYVYLNIGYNTTQFPALPEIRFTVNGKPIFDPRSGQTTFSANWALQVNDVLTGDPDLSGLGDPTVNQAQLIAAANICDEEVPNSQGGESRYTQNWYFDTGTAPGDVLAGMMPAACGKLSRIGGEWFIWPAAFLGPSLAMDESFLTDSVTWLPTRKYRDLINVVNGTYVAPNFPYSAVAPFSNLYDKNGFWYGETDNTFNMAFQPDNFPPYLQDTNHGFAANQFLIEDGGVTLPYELTLRGVASISTAQRLAKITLLRNRFQGSGTFPMSMAAWQLQPMDVVEFSFPQLGMSDTLLEVEKMQLTCQPQKDADTGEEGAMALGVSVTFNLTDPIIYEWDDTTEEQTIDALPAFTQNMLQLTPLAPTSMSVTSSAGTALIALDGTVTPRALVQWNSPEDNTVTEIDIQHQMVGAATWIDDGRVDVAVFEQFVTGLVSGQSYNFQIRSVRPPSAYSDFVAVDNVPISITLSSTVTNGSSIAPPGTLSAQAFSGGTASIFVQPFTITVGGLSVNVLPAGMFTLSGLAQDTNYFVYYSDPTFSGGAITPIATQTASAFQGVVGDFLIGSIVTPSFAPTFEPTTFTTSGSASVGDPGNAIDGNTATAASVNAIFSSIESAGPAPVEGEEPPRGGTFTFEESGSSCIWTGFQSTVTTTAMNINVIMSVQASGTFESVSVVLAASINGTLTTMETLTATTAQATYTLAVPVGTNLSTINVGVQASIVGDSNGTTSEFGNVSAAVFEIFIN